MFCFFFNFNIPGFINWDFLFQEAISQGGIVITQPLHLHRSPEMVDSAGAYLLSTLAMLHPFISEDI